MLTIGSLFSGIGGLELGLERSGLGPVLWQVEIDPFCRRVLKRHWPNARRFGNVEELTHGRRVRGWASNALQADLICGGFPCTDISNAGLRAGITGKNSSLWFDFARVIRLVRPKFVVVENVSALLHRGMDTVLGDLASSGYDAVWDCVPAAAVGAPHRRDRLFLVAWRVSNSYGERLRLGAERGEERSAQAPDRRNPFAVELGTDMANGDSPRRGGKRIAKGAEGAWRDLFDGCCGEELADSYGDRRNEGRPQREAGTGQRDAQRDREELEHADSSRSQGGSQRRLGKGGKVPRRGRKAVGDPDSGQHDGREQDPRWRKEKQRTLTSWPSEFPPSPDDMLAWGTLPVDAQPSVCRVAARVSKGVDASIGKALHRALLYRRQRLTAIGNSVVPAVAEVIGRVVIQLAKGQSLLKETA